MAVFRPRYLIGLAVLLGVAGFVFFNGDGRSLVEIAAFAILMAGLIRYIGLSVRDDDTRSLLVARRGLAGWMTDESPSGRRRRRHDQERRAR